MRCWVVGYNVSDFVYITYLGLDGGPLLCKDVLHEAVNVLRQLGIFQCVGRNLEQAKILLHEDLSRM